MREGTAASWIIERIERSRVTQGNVEKACQRRSQWEWEGVTRNESEVRNPVTHHASPFTNFFSEHPAWLLVIHRVG